MSLLIQFLTVNFIHSYTSDNKMNKQDDELSMIQLITPRENSHHIKKSVEQKSIRDLHLLSPLQQIPENTMELLNSKRKLTQKITSAQKKGFQIKERNMKGYEANKNSVENKPLSRHFDANRQTISNNDSKTSKFWKKKCISSDFHKNNDQNKAQIRRSRQRLNRVQIRERNCLSAANTSTQNIYNDKKSKNQDNPSKNQSQQKFHPLEKREKNTLNARNNSKIVSMKVRTQPEDPQDPHYQNKQDLNFDSPRQNNNKWSIVLNHQNSLWQEIREILSPQNQTKLPVMSNINKRTNQILEMIIKVVGNGAEKRLQSALLNHMKMSEAIFNHTYSYCRQWLNCFDYRETVRQFIELKKENQILRDKLLVNSCKRHSKSQKSSQSARLVRQDCIDNEKLFLTMKTNPMKLCRSTDIYNQQQITNQRFSQICSDLIQRVACQTQSNRHRKSQVHEHKVSQWEDIGNKQNLLSHNQSKHHKQSIFSLRDNENSEVNTNKIKGSMVSFHENHGPNPHNGRKFMKNKSLRSNSESLTVEKHSEKGKTFGTKQNMLKGSLEGPSICQYQILNLLLPLFDQQNQIQPKVNYYREGVAFIKKINADENSKNHTVRVLKQIMTTPYLRQSSTLKDAQTYTTTFDIRLFQAIVELLPLQKSKNFKESQFIFYIERVSILKNRQTTYRILQDLKSGLGNLLESINSNTFIKEQNKMNRDISVNVPSKKSIISNKRLMNCMKLYESKIKQNENSLKDDKHRLSGLSMVKKYANKSSFPLFSNHNLCSNRYMETILDTINQDKSEVSQNKCPSFFNHQQCLQQSQDLLSSDYEIGEVISLLYRYFKLQLVYLQRLLAGNREILYNHTQIVQKIKSQVQITIPQSIVGEIQCIYRLQQTNERMHEYINSEIQEQYVKIINYILFELLKNYMISRIK